MVERRDLTGQVLDARYRVVAPVGQGGMGSVYRAEDLKLGRVVAVKVINEQVSPEMASRRRFGREAQAMAKLEHPHCASILDVGTHNDLPFVVMDFVSGQSLDALVAEGPVPIPRAIEITRQILFGLAHAHELGIIHRDIKPANIVLSQKAGMGDHVKILDFGLAKLNQESSNLTAGIVVGTPSYMAPEQIRGLLLDARADVYACGVLLFELLTGKKPFRSSTGDPLAVCMMHLNDPPPRLADAAPGIDFGALEDVVRHALAKDRDHRFASAQAFANALAAAMPAYAPPGRLPTPLPLPRPGTPPPRPSTPPPRGSAPDAFDATVSLADGDLVPSRASAAKLDAPARDAAQTAAAPARKSGPTVAARPRPSTRPEVPARPEAPAPAAHPGRGRRWLAVAGGLALVAAVIVFAIARGRDGSPAASPAASPDGSDTAGFGSAAAPGDRDRGGAGSADRAGSDTAGKPSTSDSAAPSDDPVAALLGQADELIASGQRAAGIKLIGKARATYPRDGRLPYRLGLLYLDQMWRSEALKMLRAAIALDPSYRSDQKLIDAAVRAFNTTAGYDWTLANFLHDDVGDAARPALEDAAKNHRNPVVRNRAAAELRRYR